MWEFYIETNINNAKYLKSLENSLKFKNINLITALSEQSLSIACERKDLPKIYNKLRGYLTEMIILIYKEKFFLNNLDFSFLSKELKRALTKCLVLFDFEEDYAYVFSNLELNNGLVLDSFYKFKLKFLEDKWAQVVSLTKNNTSFLESETFLELLKFLISSITPKKDCIDVYFNGKEFVLSDENSNVIVFNDEFMTDNKELNLISGLITLAPKNINLHCASSLSNNTFKIINYVFNKKINLFV